MERMRWKPVEAVPVAFIEMPPAMQESLDDESKVDRSPARIREDWTKVQLEERRACGKLAFVAATGRLG